MAAQLTEPAFADLTGRARIREAAVRLFADNGIDGATVRDIAAAAGVSPGLVRHHFGSKESLRDACDDYVLNRLVRMKEEAIVSGHLADPGFMSAAQPPLLVFYRYLARSMADGSPSSAAMFDEMVELGERWLAQHHPGEMPDPRAFSALLIAMETGVLFMREQLSRALGADIFSPEGHLRLARAKLDFYSHPLLDRELAVRARAALDELDEGGAEGGPHAPASGRRGPRGRRPGARARHPR